MPQLNPTPWFLILAASWVVLLLIFKTKAHNLTQHNTPTTPELLAQHTTPWTWPWT